VLVRLFADPILKPTAIALGNFDGIHLGHKQVLQPIFNQSSSSRRLIPTVASFDPHPQEFFTGKAKKLLTTLPEKTYHLQKIGIEQLVLLPFNHKLAELTPESFVEKILVNQLDCRLISIGEDFRFGHNRAGTALDLAGIADRFNIPVNIVCLTKCQSPFSVRISSSLIRQALEEGDLTQVAKMLGRPYILTGVVVKGQQLGSKIGFPTANLEVSPEKFLPKIGVYSVGVLIDNQEYLGVMNLGCRPTVEGKNLTIEVHLLDWHGDLYGKNLSVTLLKFLRPEQKFSSLDALKAQIALDCETTKQLFSPISS